MPSAQPLSLPHDVTHVIQVNVNESAAFLTLTVGLPLIIMIKH
jgi:hypothetical protein